MSRLQWSTEQVAARLQEAADTDRRLPSVGPQGYRSLWPVCLRQEWERLSHEDRQLRPLPPSPEEIERMLEVMGWMQWLQVEQRHLAWMRAKHYGWRDIARRFGCCSKTAQRRWDAILQGLAQHLNGRGS